MIYISPIITNIPESLRGEFGYMVGLVSRPQDRHLARYQWMLDNGAFTGRFEVGKWLDKLHTLEPYSATCIGVIVPDAVGNKEMTLEMWHDFAHFPASLGFRLAFAAQDGMTIDDIPWDELDVLFIGGSKEWKYHDAWPLMREANRRGVWLHIGRVNSQKSMWHFQCADSVDGTQLIFTPQWYRQALRTSQAIASRKAILPLFDN